MTGKPPKLGAATPPRDRRLAAVRDREAARDAALAEIAGRAPLARFLGVALERAGGEVTARLPFSPTLIGNPFLPAIHGGAIGALLEITAICQLQWEARWAELESDLSPPLGLLRPKTIDISVDFLRSARAQDLFARAHVTRKGRRVANVRAEAWQEERSRPVAAAHAHFLLAEPASVASRAETET